MSGLGSFRLVSGFTHRPLVPEAAIKLNCCSATRRRLPACNSSVNAEKWWCGQTLMPASATQKNPADPAHCLVQSVAAALAAEPALEAVTINPARHEISIATIGKASDPQLAERITATVRELREDPAGAHCGLLTGGSDCFTCDRPLPPGMLNAITINRQNDATTIARVTCPTAPRFWRWRSIPWPKLVPREVEVPEDEEHLDEWKPQLLAAGLCAGFGIAAALTRGPVSSGLFLASYLAGAWFPAVEVWELLQKRRLDVHFLMLAVAAGSAAVGEWAEGATLLFLFSFASALEHYAMGRTQREIRSLFKTAPKTATLLDDAGHEHEALVEKLCAGQRLLLKPGAQFPVDAEIVKGRTASDESNLTGEATPVEKTVGDTVLAGTMNLWGAVEAVVLRPASESALEKIVRLIREAQHLKAPSQRFTDRFGTGYTYGILGLSFAMFLVWWLGFRLPPFVSTAGTHSAFYRTMTLLVVASPCALVLSIPSAVLAAIAWGARRGVLFRGGAAVEKLAEIDVVALDKTGTLTTGELQVERVESFPPGREAEIVRMAYSLEKLSTHPLARAITRHGKREQLVAVELDHFESVTGLGIQARHAGREYRLGRREWVVEEARGAVPAAAVGEDGTSEVWLGNGELLGRVVLRDDIRPQARAVVEALRTAGLRTVVLTGDRPATGEFLKSKLAVDEVRAGLKPEQKVAAIHALTQSGRHVAMVGDGVNDAPSLAAAHVGVAMGARGADAALEQAEVVLMHDRLENFLAAFQLSQRARRVIRQNLFISLGTVAVLVALALGGVIPLTLGVVGHEGSTVVVVVNSLRLLFSRTGGNLVKDEL